MDSKQSSNILFIAFCVVFLLVVIGFLSNRTSVSESEVVEGTRNLSAAQQKIVNNDPLERAELEIFFKDVLKESRAQRGKQFLDHTMQRMQNNDHKRELAAGAYIGYEVRNTLAIKDFCKRYAVDVEVYSQAVLSAHRSVRQHVGSLNITNESRTETYEKLRLQMLPAIQDEMALLGEFLRKNTRAACIFLRDNPEQMLKMGSFEKLYPQQYKILMAR